MKDENKKKEQLIAELSELRKRVANLEKEKSKSAPKNNAGLELDLLDQILSISPYAIIISDLHGIIKDCNQETLRMLGFSRKDEIIGINGFDILHPVDKARAIKDMEHTLERAPVRNLEYNCITKDGREITVETSVGVVSDRESNPDSYIVIAHDITEKIKTESAFLESETKYLTLVDNAFDGVVIIQDEIFRFVNKAMAGMSGYSEEELTGMKLRDLVSSEKGGPVIGYNEAASRDKGGSLSVYTYTLKCKDGSIKDVEVASSLTVYDGLSAIVGIVRDVTDRKRAEAALRESEEKYRRIVENSSDVIMLTQPDGIITYLSPASRTVLGYDPDELVGTNPEIYHPDDKDKVTEIFSLALEGAFGTNFEYRILTRFGETKWISHSWSPSFKEDRLYSVISVIRDITDLKEAQSEKEKLEEQLRQSQKMEAIGRLAGGVAHDFNNLLTAITGYSDLLLLDLAPGDSLRKGVGEIKNAANRAAALTRQLLAFSRRQPLQQKVLEINRLISNIENMLKRLMGEDIKLVTSLEPDLCQVRADPGQIEQILMNLAVNSRDAMPQGGVLKIKTENVVLDDAFCLVTTEAVPGSYVCIIVEDDGVGIPKDVLEHIFEPFYTTKGHEGTGLGLSVVYGIVKQHGGWLNAYSETGRGTLFNIYLPSISEAANERAREVSVPRELYGSGESILLVEDDEMVREFARGIISENGYRVIAASNAAEAIKSFEENNGRFELVIADAVLPDKSGLQLVEQLISLKPELRVLLCSGYTEDRSRGAVILERGFKFLQKPYTIDELLYMISELIVR